MTREEKAMESAAESYCLWHGTLAAYVCHEWFEVPWWAVICGFGAAFVWDFVRYLRAKP